MSRHYLPNHGKPLSRPVVNERYLQPVQHHDGLAALWFLSGCLFMFVNLIVWGHLLGIIR